MWGVQVCGVLCVHTLERWTVCSIDGSVSQITIPATHPPSTLTANPLVEHTPIQATFLVRRRATASRKGPALDDRLAVWTHLATLPSLLARLALSRSLYPSSSCPMSYAILSSPILPARLL